MRPLLLLVPALLLACSPDAPPPATTADQPPPVPEAFEEKGAVKEIIDGRGSEYSNYRDVVEQMFTEELERDTALAHLFERIQDTRQTFSDSTQDFHRLQGNDRIFYGSAHGHAGQLADTLERKRMNDRLKVSEAKADARFTALAQMDSTSSKLTRELGQLRTLVMLDRTITRMEDYQRTPVPGKTGMSKALQELRALRDQLRAQVK